MDVCDKLSIELDLNEKEIDELFRKIMLKASDNGHKVPILAITIDLEKYNEEHKGSCRSGVTL